MKPDYICDQSRSSGDNIAINLSKAAPILKFCEDNGIGLRGHTFVWYSQTPEWIFKENMQSNSGGFVSPDRMNKRLESMIKNTFEAIKTQYPNLKLYSYDVCNELFKNDGGGFRGDGGEYSNWWKCYGDDSFVINAFKYARQYAPKDCKLYMNDYNEYFVLKCDDLYNMAKKIQAAGDYIDGIGMQSHMHAADFGGTGSATKSTDPQFGTYADAIDKFNSLGLDVQITELDVTNCAAKAGADLFVDIFKVAMERSGKISSLTLWGHCDSASWRNSYQDGGKPLPFDGNCQPKSFYNDIINLTTTIKPGPVEEEVTTTTVATTTKPVETTTQTTTAGNITTTTAPIETTQPPQQDVKPSKLGDVSCDNKTDVSDAVLLARLLAEDNGAVVTAVGKANADCNKNGKPDQEDITMILQAIAKLISL
jgi:endo-1,4-beta-xylanase